MDSERIDLPDGQWWEIRSVVTRAMRKAFRKAGLQAFLRGANGSGPEIDMQNEDALQKLMMQHPERWDLEAVDDAYLLYGSLSSSLLKDVSLEAIDQLPDKYVEPVLARMRELYAQPSEEQLKNSG